MKIHLKVKGLYGIKCNAIHRGRYGFQSKYGVNVMKDARATYDPCEVTCLRCVSKIQQMNLRFERDQRRELESRAKALIAQAKELAPWLEIFK